MVKDRLKKFMEDEGLNARELAELIDVQPSSISHIINGRNNPGMDFVEKLMKAFPTLDVRWLITGEYSSVSNSLQKPVPDQIKVDTQDEGSDRSSSASSSTKKVILLLNNGKFEEFTAD